jgi:hypothetical protein
MVDPGEAAEIIIKYRLPFKFTDKIQPDIAEKISDILNGSLGLYSYSLLVQKQPGALGSEFVGRIDMPMDNQTVWQYPAGNKGTGSSIIKDKISEDKYYALIFKKNK